MNILLCTSRMGIGGAETHILSLAEELVRRGHSVSVASSGGVYEKELTRLGVPHLKLPLDRKDPLSLAASRRGLLKAARFCDIVHAHGRIPAFVCGTLSDKRGFPPFVTTAHGLYDSSEPKRKLTNWGECTAAVSEQVEEYLKTVYGLPQERIAFIPNGIKIPDNTQEYTSPVTVIAASGRMEKDTEGQFLLLLKVFERLIEEKPDITLKLAGDGSSRGRIRAAAEKINLSHPHSVSLPGNITDMDGFLSGCSVFAGQSRSALEAMARGIPTVVFSDRGCEGLLSPDNSEKLFRSNYIPTAEGSPEEKLYISLSSLFSGPELRASCGSYARSFVTAHNTVERMAEQTFDMYVSVLDRLKNAVTLLGYFGAGNTGDELTLKAVINHIQPHKPDIPIYVITRKPDEVPPGCRGILNTDMGRIGRALRSSRVFILCGGSLLQNATSRRSLAYYLHISRMALDCGCRCQLWGGGLGPIYGKAQENKTAEVLSRFSACCMRDTDSYEAVLKYTDRAFLSADEFCIAFMRRDGIKSNCFAVAPRKLKNRKSTDNLVKALEKGCDLISEKYGLSPVFVPMSPEDTGICRALASACRGKTLSTFEKHPPEVFKRAAFTVAVRLHAAVTSASNTVPAICLSYDPKVASFAKETGLPCLDAYNFTAEELASAADSFPGKEILFEKMRQLSQRRAQNTLVFLKLYRYDDLKKRI